MPDGEEPVVEPTLESLYADLQVADVDEDVAVNAGVVAKVSTSDGVERLSSELLELYEATFRSLTAQTLGSYAGKLSQFAEFFHDSENISPLEATTATVVRYVAWIAFAREQRLQPTPSEYHALSHIRYHGGWATNSDVVLDCIDPNVLPLPGAWFFFGHIAPLHHFQVQHDSAAVAFPLCQARNPAGREAASEVPSWDELVDKLGWPDHRAASDLGRLLGLAQDTQSIAILLNPLFISHRTDYFPDREKRFRCQMNG
eukprot:jgi/Tetstr1/435775/TSEL_024667.t2